MKCLWPLFTLFLLVALTSALAFAAPPLPDVSGWECGDMQTTVFDTISGNLGYWHERDYRTENGLRVHTVLMGGKGPGMRFFPAAGIDADDGLIGSGAHFTTFSVSGYPALFERHPILGSTLSIKLDTAYLTIETADGNTDPQKLTDTLLRILNAD